MAEMENYGELRKIGEEIKTYSDGKRAAIITDENVAALYLDLVKGSLEGSGFITTTHIIPPGEDSKSGEVYLRLLEEMAEASLDRSDVIVALGGGVVGDLAGFVASTYMRGIDVVQVPTTLLAIVDSSIGGKTGINLSKGKNLAGTFHMPKAVIRHREFLETLSEQQIREGMAEVIKTAMIVDPELFLRLEKIVGITSLKEVAVSRAFWGIVERCALIKGEIVEADPLEKGERKLLNFGHTVGHAIERLTDYRVSHGDAVAKGMFAMAKLSEESGWCTKETADRLEKLLLACGFDLSFDYPEEELYSLVKMDKKKVGDTITLVVPKEIGHAVLKDMVLS